MADARRPRRGAAPARVHAGCARPGGRPGAQGTFPGTERPGYVYLPPGFDRAVRYPVVYLLHGMPGSPSEYLDGTQLPSFADTGSRPARLRPFIAVMPAAGADRDYNGEWAGPWEQRARRADRPVDRRAAADDRGRARARDRRALGGRLRRGRHRACATRRSSGRSSRGAATSRRCATGRSSTRRAAVLAANDPTRLVCRGAVCCSRATQTRFFVSTGPPHSHWAPPSQTIDFAGRLRCARAALHAAHLREQAGRVARPARRRPALGLRPHGAHVESLECSATS